ncbi:MAG: hypothetical protein EKK37_17980 [Sphingobacteriales bacterium]|nr:MAG: hypothetical protein EKK37_17980 [Sphingobacteriales bacterium]
MKTLKVSLKAIVFILTAAASLNVNAASGIEHKHFFTGKSNSVKLAHAGFINNQPSVRLSFENTAGEKVLITVKDESGIIVYTELFTGAAYSKQFMFEKELADANPVITVTYLNSKKTETYTISNRETDAEGLQITKK